VDNRLLRIPLLGKVIIQNPERLLFTQIPLVHVLSKSLSVRTHQIHGLIVHGTVYHVLIVVIVHRRLIDVIGHYPLSLSKLPQLITLLQQEIPMHSVRGLLGYSIPIRSCPTFCGQPV